MANNLRKRAQIPSQQTGTGWLLARRWPAKMCHGGGQKEVKQAAEEEEEEEEDVLLLLLKYYYMVLFE